MQYYIYPTTRRYHTFVGSNGVPELFDSRREARVRRDEIGDGDGHLAVGKWTRKRALSYPDVRQGMIPADDES